MVGKPKVLFVDKDVKMNEWARRELEKVCELEVASTGEFNCVKEMIFRIRDKREKFDAIILNPEIPPASLIQGDRFSPKVHALKWLEKNMKLLQNTQVMVLHGSKPNPMPKGMIYVNTAKGNCFRLIRERLGVQPKKLTRRARIWNNLRKLRQRLPKRKARRV